jgi:hypothetical protein
MQAGTLQLTAQSNASWKRDLAKSRLGMINYTLLGGLQVLLLVLPLRPPTPQQRLPPPGAAQSATQHGASSKASP